METTVTAQEEVAKKPKKKIDWWKVLEFSLPALIALGIFFFAMIIKGVYPFGDNHIGYIDYDDGLVPAYTYLWDVLHGNANVFVDWNLGAGGSFVTSAITNSFLSPISWLIAIFPRSGIMYGIAFLVVIKLMLMATTAYICFKKYFPNISKWLLLLFCLTWTFSGWTLVHFTNIGWLDIMILLPLLLISMKKLVSTGKIFWTVIILSYMLMLSYYITYMVLVGVVVIATLYVCLLAKDKKRTASSLFWAIIISILISAVAFIPSCLTSLQAHRFGSAEESGIGSLFENFFTKLSVIIMFALPVVFFVRLLCTYKKDKKTVLFFMLAFIICSIGLIIEPINEMWHTGSYYSFPFRYSFVIILLMIFGSLYYINRYISSPQQVGEPDNTGKVENKKKVNWVWALLPPVMGAAIIATIFGALMATLFIPYRPMSIRQGILWIVIFAATYGTIELLLRLKVEKLKLGKMAGGAIIFALCIAQIFALTVGFVGVPDSNIERITNAEQIDTSILEDGYKLKDREALYNHNFGYITSYPTLSTWIHISSEQQFQAYNMLGYNSSSTILFSSGGTMMTDVLLGNKYVLSREQLNSSYYTLLDTFNFVDESSKEEGEINLYELNFEMHPAYAVNSDLSQVLSEWETWFDAQNLLFKEFYGSQENVIETFDASMVITPFELTDEEIEQNPDAISKGYVIELQVPTDKNIYLASTISSGLNATINDLDRTIYYGLTDLGFNETGRIEIVVEDLEENLTEQNILDAFSFGAFDAELFASEHAEFATNNSIDLRLNGVSIQLQYNNTEGYAYAFVPYTYLNNMTGTNNGESVEVKTAFDGFMFVQLQDGENQITITYEPQYLKICLIVTLVAIALFVIFSGLNWKFDLASKKWIVWPGFIGACLILGVVGVLVYIKPFFYDFFVRLF